MYTLIHGNGEPFENISDEEKIESKYNLSQEKLAGVAAFLTVFDYEINSYMSIRDENFRYIDAYEITEPYLYKNNLTMKYSCYLYSDNAEIETRFQFNTSDFVEGILLAVRLISFTETKLRDLNVTFDLLNPSFPRVNTITLDAD